MVIGGRAKSENPRINGTRAYIADCAVSSAYRESGEAAANARLIAAAPELLEALKGIRDIAEVVAPGSAFMPDIAKICKTAIAKGAL